MSNLQAEEYKTFEFIKKIRTDGTEFWYARELSEVLQYTEWRNFSKVLDRAKLACENSGGQIRNHFVEVNKMVAIGSNTKRQVLDYELSRYACYLIVQNGDPRKEVIALGQTYFAIQTRRQIEEMYPNVKEWRLDTILQEKGNCHLYENMGYEKTGEIKT